MTTDKYKKAIGIYIHIPLCLSKCRYCDFCSFPLSDKALINDYVAALCREAQSYATKASDYTADSIYFGGGTPTLLDISHIESIMTTLRRTFDISTDAEITAECNPATADAEYLRRLRGAGVNRLSIGMQSADDGELKILGRRHDFSDFLKVYGAAREAGFDNINVDVMYGIPTQTEENFAKTLKTVTELAPEHVSAYGLKLEYGTDFYKNRENLAFPDEDTQYNMYVSAYSLLNAAGIKRYEISNFARDGKCSRHNLKYWLGDEYIGLGVSAHSYFGGMRYSHGRNIHDYIAGRHEKGTGFEQISDAEKMREYIMLRFRLEKGINKADFKARFGQNFDALYGDALKKYLFAGYAEEYGERENIRLTTDGMMISNTVLSELLY